MRILLNSSFEVVLGRELASLVYWWKPDPSFLREDASEIILPPYDPEAHSRKAYSSAREKLRLTSWAAAGMDVAAYRAFALADALSMSNQEMDALLVKHLEKESADGSGADHWETACAWLKEQNIWKPWIPSDTACVRGKGLVDALGNYVTQVDAAVGCEVCPVGTSSQDQPQQSRNTSAHSNWLTDSHAERIIDLQHGYFLCYF